ncbi:31448_t:CDS:10 [Gigaspora margarita]|uniref:Pheromone-processing carboxypeptidase KEX1 n=1 Tax=Gigaspora margarita TaxID=4874 RepID=A0ABN7UUA9_GIGMA|nr:31448_t:CDS:10 [Gigaspora margarita]
MDGVFLESGPWRINNDQTLRLIDGAWNEYANVLYVDQPIGTGFSFANSNSYLHNVTQVPDQFLLFLDKFFEIFPEYAKDEMYLAGESFAGTFIPYIASAILKRNSERKSSVNLRYNLKGIAIGNGWIDPIAQHNLLDEEHKTLAKDQLDICMKSQKEKVRIHSDECEKILRLILKNSRKRVGEKETCINQYDIRDHSDSFPSCGISWPYELETVSTYLRRSDVIGAIHASAQQIGWIECNNGVGRGFDNDPSPPSVQLLPSILKQINVLLYAGDQDLICNRKGLEDMIKELEWNGAKGFQNLTEKPWVVNDKPAGYMLSERNLTYVVVHDASHMISYDKPGASMALMYWFMGIDHQITTKISSKFGYGLDTTTPNVEDTIYDNGDNEILDRYYNAGTATLIVVICSVIALAVFVFRGKFRRRKSGNQAMKAAVDSSDSEMAELVIETPLNSEDIDHFGDSDEEEGHGHGHDRSPLTSRMHKNQDG